MKNFLLVVVVILASTLVESQELKELEELKDPEISSPLEWKIHEALVQNNTMIQPRIVGGTVAGYDAYPYHARLTLLGAVVSGYLILGWCGGSIISPNWVLTAAHCLDIQLLIVPYAVVAVNVEAGGSSTSQFRQAHLVLLLNFRIHPTYNSESRYNDLALIRTGTWNFHDSYVQPIKLPPYSLNIEQYNTKTAVATGYGVTTNTATGPPSSTLRYIVLKVILRAACVSQYGRDIPTSAFCAEDPVPPKGSVCTYDLGGPLALTESGVTTLIGVASFTHPIRRCDGTAQGFQMVAREVPWIKGVTGIL